MRRYGLRRFPGVIARVLAVALASLVPTAMAAAQTGDGFLPPEDGAGLPTEVPPQQEMIGDFAIF
jgi:hypothetical protein